MMTRPFRVVAIVAAFNEEDIVAQTVRALIDDGIEVYFLDNHSTDRTRAEVEPWVGRGVVAIETFPEDGPGDRARFQWERILKRKEELASQLEADWFIHHDADEFRESPWNGVGLRDGIRLVDDAGYNAVDFKLFNFWPTSADNLAAVDIRDRQPFFEPGEAFNHVQIKCWKRTGARVVLSESGGHDVDFENRRVFPIRFLLRHYPVRSQAHAERKILQERKPRFETTERERGWHVQYDHFVAGTPVVREARDLVRFDPDAARLAVTIRHREVERLEGEIGRLAHEVADARRAADETRVALDECHRQRTGLEDQVRSMAASTSWRITSPLRFVDEWLRGRKGSRENPPGDDRTR